jgi:parvulin-like peptidyl-prolyl isomerase
LFSKLARSESTDRSAAKGGELGPLTPGSNSFVAPFQKAAEALKPGEVSEPVHSKFGWHVIFVHKNVQSFSEARVQITQQVAGPRQNQEWQRWVIAAYRDAHVNVNPSYGTLDLNTQTIVDRAGSFPGAAKTTPPQPQTSSPSG